jgi:nicotinamide mononucleotide adenylyltransferase
MIPKFLKNYFWDVDIAEVDKEKNEKFIIERILEHGNKKAVNWMKKTFPKNRIKDVVRKSRRLSLRTANYWAVIFNLKRNDVLCLRRYYQKKPNLIWKY